MEIKKTLLVTLLAALAVAGAVAKEKPLDVTKTDWGLEVSNVNAKGKIICKDGIIFKNTTNIDNDIYILINVDDINSDIPKINQAIRENLNIPIFYKESSGRYMPHNIFQNKKNEKNSWVASFIDLSPMELEMLRNNPLVTSTNPLSIKDKNINKFYVYTNGEITNYKAYSDGSYFHLEILGHISSAEKKAEAERLAAEKKASMKAKTENDGGYNDMPWGTSVDDFLSARPDAKKIEDEGVVERYARKGSSGSEMTYKFYNGELVGGVTVYNLNGDDAETKGNDINQRMKELYEKWTDVKETSEHKNVTINFLGSTHKIAYTEKHLKTTWNKSSSFKILLDVRALIGDTKNDTYNICMYITTNLLTYTINYENPSMAKEIAEANIKLEKEQVEAKKQQEEAEKRRRMDNLDL